MTAALWRAKTRVDVMTWCAISLLLLKLLLLLYNLTIKDHCYEHYYYWYYIMNYYIINNTTGSLHVDIDIVIIIIIIITKWLFSELVLFLFCSFFIGFCLFYTLMVCLVFTWFSTTSGTPFVCTVLLCSVTEMSISPVEPPKRIWGIIRTNSSINSSGKCQIICQKYYSF